MKDLEIFIAPMVPSKGINPKIMQDQFIFRKTGIYNGKSTIGIADMQEPIWWNRPLDSDSLVKKEVDGLCSYNMPLAGGQAFKSAYNILLNKNSVPIAIQLLIDRNWTTEQLEILHTAVFSAVYNALISLGVDANRLTNPHNDLLYDGKKFMGIESLEKNGWYSANCFVTLQYSPEKMVFDRLTGEFAQSRGITGIIEETGLFTKEEFIKALLEEFNKILAKLD